MSTENDVARSLRSWLREDRYEDADRVLDAVFDQVPTTPQRRAGWLARRFPPMNNAVRIALIAAAVLVIAVVGYNLLPRSNTVGPPGPSQSAAPTATSTDATSSLSPGEFAVGSFSSHGGEIELEASGEGANVTGTMTYVDVGGAALGGFVVDLACTRTSDAGLILIGGPIIESTKGYVQDAPVGSNIAMVLQRGSPVRAFIHVEHPDPHEANCLAFLESVPDLGDPGFESSILEPIVGTVALRP